MPQRKMRTAESVVRLFSIGLLLALSLSSCCRKTPVKASLPIPADGMTDATAAIQQRLDAAGQKGGEVLLPPGRYLLRGNLTVPRGVALRGSWIAPHNGNGWDKGTTFLVTGGRNDENATPTLTLATDSALNGITFLWPGQKWNDIRPYPWAIASAGEHASVENVTFVNAYQGIRLGAPDSSLHYVRNVFGCVLRRGIFVDCCYDIGRIENVHFNPHYWIRSHYPPGFKFGPDVVKAIQDYPATHLEAFTFGRTDWEYGFDTFVWGAKDGYHFIQTTQGTCDGQFIGMGADYCQSCVQVDALQAVGLQITAGQFTAFAGSPGTAIVTAPMAGGSVLVVNSTFYATTRHSVWMQGQTEVTLSACHLLDAPPGGAVLAERGKLIVQGCSFDQPGTAVVLKQDVTAAVVTGNLQPGGFQVQNEMGKRARIALNQTP